MITEHDLQEAIAECEGQRNPTASTCMKLASFYTIRQHMFPQANELEGPPAGAVGYSYSGDSLNYAEVGIIRTNAESDFGKLADGMAMQDFMSIMDDAMQTLSVINPRFYNSIMQKLSMVRQ